MYPTSFLMYHQPIYWKLTKISKIRVGLLVEIVLGSLVRRAELNSVYTHTPSLAPVGVGRLALPPTTNQRTHLLYTCRRKAGPERTSPAFKGVSRVFRSGTARLAMDPWIWLSLAAFVAGLLMIITVARGFFSSKSKKRRLIPQLCGDGHQIEMSPYLLPSSYFR